MPAGRRAGGPTVGDRATVLFCAWLAWSQFRVVVALRDKTLPSVVMALDRSLRVFGGAPTYALYEYVPGHACQSSVPNPIMWPAAGRHL
jgi:hypothetical protein